MKVQIKPLLVCLAVPLLVGGLSALLTGNSMQVFAAVNKPPLSPPGWVFPIVWTLLFLLMGLASYLVLVSGEKNGTALLLYVLQLLVNFGWSLIFFRAGAYGFAFIWLVLLWALILATTLFFYRVSPPAACLMIPYLVWVTFAGYLNLGVFLLN